MELLSDAAVLSEVRALVSKCHLRYTVHAEERMSERGYTRDDVRQCLQRGGFVESPSVPNRPGAIQYVFRIHALIEGREIDVVAALNPADAVVVITVIDPS
ncbi:DUF4258 domain-containing protein [Methyloversatilis sp. NSM2]|uniref:DUF4258 domain-containing protein n=1 Tax=Methyloversatilis sp. NSM2 TaxID=3134135 RepID=UPI0040534804